MTDVENSVFEPQRAAIDITGGYAADFFLRSTARGTEWDRQSFVALIDTLINHREVVYPLPNRGSLRADPKSTLPAVISLAQKEALLAPVRSTFAEDVPAPPDWLEVEYAGFLDWAALNIPSLKSWCAQHGTSTKRRQAVKRIPGRISTPVKEFLSAQDDARLKALIAGSGIAPDDLALAFDVTIRGVQYHRIFGPDTAYFAHPIRSRLLSTKVDRRHSLGIRWSWGSLIARAIEDGRIERSPARLIEIVSDLRTRSLRDDATWYGLARSRERDVHRKVSDIAAAARMPAKLKSTALEKLAEGMAIAGLAAKAMEKGTGYPTSYLGIVLEIGAIAVQRWDGHVPGVAGKLRFCRGLLDWEGLFLEEPSRPKARAREKKSRN